MKSDQNSEVAARMRRRARRMRAGNVVMRRLLDLPFRTPISDKLMLLYYRGRRSGRSYRQPVSFVPMGDVLVTPGGGRWKENLRDGEAITARIRGRKRSITPELIRDRAEVERLLQVMTERSRRLASFVPFIAADGTIDPRGLDLALDRGFCIVRWHDSGERT